MKPDTHHCWAKGAIAKREERLRKHGALAKRHEVQQQSADRFSKEVSAKMGNNHH